MHTPTSTNGKPAPAIPRKAIYRLSLYQRCLQQIKASAVEKVSSEALARAAGVKSAQLRRDLAYFGQFGTRGSGYPVAELSRRLTETLGMTRLQPVVLIGLGNLGAALLGYKGFNKEGFEIAAAFDIRTDLAAPAGVTVPLLPMPECGPFIRQHAVKMAILAVPPASAQEVTNELVASGIQAILNFAPVVLSVPDRVKVNNVDLALELENLSYFIRD